MMKMHSIIVTVSNHNEELQIINEYTQIIVHLKDHAATGQRDMKEVLKQIWQTGNYLKQSQIFLSWISQSSLSEIGLMMKTTLDTSKFSIVEYFINEVKNSIMWMIRKEYKNNLSWFWQYGFRLIMNTVKLIKSDHYCGLYRKSEWIMRKFVRAEKN